MQRFNNPQKKNVYISVTIAMIGLLMMLSSFTFNIDMMDGGGALILIGIFIFITALIVAVLFRKREKLLDSIISGEELLAYWKYDEDSWKNYAEENYQLSKERNTALLFVVGGISIIIGVAFLIINPEDAGGFVFLVLIALVILLAIVAYLFPYLGYMRNKRNVGDVFIAPYGVYINKLLHEWKTLGSKLEKVEIIGKKNIIQFTYSVIMSYRRQSFNVNVLIPKGKESEAIAIINYFKDEKGGKK